MDAVDTVVIGGGVVGLAVARAFARQGVQTLLLEREHTVGTGCSSRNSEVIHAGLYYASDSLKARLCVRGREALYAYCEAHGVPHRRCGKLLVATDESQRPQLERIHDQARRNGVADLTWLDARALSEQEPTLRAVAALSSPSTGIIDSHALMWSLWGDFEAHGGTLALRAEVQSVHRDGDRHVLHVGGVAPMELAARQVVNAAGMWAPALAGRVRGLAPAHVPEPRFAKGNYFSLSVAHPYTRLIYPMPDEGGLGVHLTLDLAGRARFGPDVQWLAPSAIDVLDYRVDEGRTAAFEAAVRRYWPDLPRGSLTPDYAGVRPKVIWQGQMAQDFLIEGPAAHGLDGWVNLYGIESPGLTACLAIADEVLSRLMPATPSALGQRAPSVR